LIVHSLEASSGSVTSDECGSASAAWRARRVSWMPKDNLNRVSREVSAWWSPSLVATSSRGCEETEGAPGIEAAAGLALRVLHHRMFDFGAFTVAEGFVLVSDQVHGTSGFHEALMAHHGGKIREPQRPNWSPKPRHLA
jgi:hypothetical protein